MVALVLVLYGLAHAQEEPEPERFDGGSGQVDDMFRGIFGAFSGHGIDVEDLDVYGVRVLLSL